MFGDFSLIVCPQMLHLKPLALLLCSLVTWALSLVPDGSVGSGSSQGLEDVDVPQRSWKVSTDGLLEFLVPVRANSFWFFFYI